MDWFTRSPGGVLRLRIGGRVFEEVRAHAAEDALHGSLVREHWDWHGWVRATVIDHDTGRVFVEEFPNLIVNAGLNLMRDVIGGFASDGKIHYVALGTSSTAVAAGDTQLGAESFRKAVTQYDNTPGTGQVKTTLYVAPGEALIAIAELGWFAGSTATSSANTGTLLAHTLYSHTHVSTESITIQRTDTL